MTQVHGPAREICVLSGSVPDAEGLPRVPRRGPAAVGGGESSDRPLNDSDSEAAARTRDSEARA